jgi:hypothetical protein
MAYRDAPAAARSAAALWNEAADEIDPPLQKANLANLNKRGIP